MSTGNIRIRLKDFFSFTLIPGLFGAALGLTMVYCLYSFLGQYHFPGGSKSETLDTRVETLSRSLRDASKIISDIEGEINERRRLVTSLQADADQAQKLKDLNSAQVNAVSQALRGQLKAEDDGRFWHDTLIGTVFGAIGTKILDWLLERFREMRKKNVAAPSA